jgi:hypothetical protein
VPCGVSLSKSQVVFKLVIVSYLVLEWCWKLVHDGLSFLEQNYCPQSPFSLLVPSPVPLSTQALTFLPLSDSSTTIYLTLGSFYSDLVTGALRGYWIITLYLLYEVKDSKFSQKSCDLRHTSAKSLETVKMLCLTQAWWQPLTTPGTQEAESGKSHFYPCMGKRSNTRFSRRRLFVAPGLGSVLNPATMLPVLCFIHVSDWENLGRIRKQCVSMTHPPDGTRPPHFIFLLLSIGYSWI